MWGLPLDEVHVTRLDGRAGRREAGVAQHSGELLAGDIGEIDGMPDTSATRSALDLTTITDIEHWLPVIDHLLHTRRRQTSRPRPRSEPSRCVARHSEHRGRRTSGQRPLRIGR